MEGNEERRKRGCLQELEENEGRERWEMKGMGVSWGSKKPGGSGDKEMLKRRCSKKGEGSGAEERSRGSGAMGRL